MYNLIVSSNGSISAASSRIFEYTQQETKKLFLQADGSINIQALKKLPTLFVKEFRDEPDVPVHVGHFRHYGSYEIIQSPFIPIFSARYLSNHMEAFTMEECESTRTHWAVKDGDLFEILGDLFRDEPGLGKLINTIPTETIVKNRIAVMMPFKPEFDEAYVAIQQACQNAGFTSIRVDELYDPVDILEQILDLIKTSMYVIVDTSGFNPNVFFETGFAMGVGKTFIPITSTPEKGMPFDMQKFRYTKYYNNEQGRSDLTANLTKTLQTLNNR